MTFDEMLERARREFVEVVEDAVDQTVDTMRSLGGTPRRSRAWRAQTERMCWAETWPRLFSGYCMERGSKTIRAGRSTSTSTLRVIQVGPRPGVLPLCAARGGGW